MTSKATGDRSRRRSLGLLASLGSLSFGVRSAFDTPGLVAAVADHVIELARADQFALLLLNDATGELEGDHYERGRSSPTGHSRILAEPQSFLGRVLRRETLVFESSSAEAAPIAWQSGPSGSLVGVPILIGTSLLGVSVIGYQRRITLTERRRRALLFLADQIGLAVDRIRMRSELDATRKQLEDSVLALRKVDEAKSDLISIVSHELRTPLTAIKAYTETLIDNLQSPSFTMQEKFLVIVNEECDRLSRIVNDVLDLSRMESGRRRLKAEPVSIAQLLEDVTGTVAPELTHKDARLRTDLAAELPQIEADPDLLKQVLVNLIGNAAKFTRHGTDVVVRAATQGERVVVSVEDHGLGIPADKLDRVFERFYRIEEIGMDRVSGTGLGLAIVKSVVDLHGGAVRVESVVGEGSRFVFDLPIRQQGFRQLMRSLTPFFERPELKLLLSSCVEMVAEVMDARIVSFMFFNEEGTDLSIRASHGLDAETVARTRVRLGDSVAGWVAQTSENLCVEDIESDGRFRRMNHPQYETKSLLCVPLRVTGETVGVINVNNKTTGTLLDQDDLNLLIAISRRVGVAIERVRAAGETGDISAMLATLRAIVRARRTRLLPSSRRLFKMATDLGKRLGMDSAELEVLGYVARVHDVGMLAVSEDLVGSGRRWTDSEHRQVEAHPQAAVQILRPIEFASKVNAIILSHHEHYDGGGYPRGLQGEEIPLGARVLAVLDAYEAMVAGRPYREPFTQAEALAEIERCGGSQFDPRVVAEFARLLAERAEPGRDTAPRTAPGTDPRNAGTDWNRDVV
ncbi:MAG TPA: HD domain-containing phosphohydrolase, partial [Candidatus Eisenbacteria bacterium]|nr:HD domain-containing phosphohydrolase [Candidatus Eisenbacteria bacterium]